MSERGRPVSQGRGARQLVLVASLPRVGQESHIRPSLPVGVGITSNSSGLGDELQVLALGSRDPENGQSSAPRRAGLTPVQSLGCSVDPVLSLFMATAAQLLASQLSSI